MGTAVVPVLGGTTVVARGEAVVAVVLGEADGERLHPAIPMARPTNRAVIE
jgi:hypothetical protein